MYAIESIKTTYMENVNTGVLDKNKEPYLRSKDKAEKSNDVLRQIQLHMSKCKKKNGDLQSIMSNLQPNCCLKVDFENVGKHTGGKLLNHDTKRHKGKSIPEIKTWNSPAEYPSCVARCYIKGPDGTMLNPIFWKKVQGQKHPERWEIEHPLGD